MNTLKTLLLEPSVAHDIFALSIVVVCGLWLGSLKLKGVGLGVAGVLFAGLALGHFGLGASEATIHLVRDLGLILFVYGVGVQVGPGFLSNIKSQGLPLNILAALIVLLGGVITLVVCKVGGIPMPVAAGLFSGATTNTPSLAAVQETLREMPNAAANAGLPGLGYAVAYPFGVLGIILTMLGAKALFKVDIVRENEEMERHENKPALDILHIEVQNPNLDGLAIRELPRIKDSGVVVSRIRKGALVSVARGKTIVNTGDILLLVGEPERLQEFGRIIGKPVEGDLRADSADLTTRRLIVTRRQVVGKTVYDMGWASLYGVVVTRVMRAGLELVPRSKLRLQFGDTLLCIGSEDALKRAAESVGNSSRELEHPALLPVFVGIVLGIVVGSIPLAVPGIPAPLKLGLAGGPLLVAIALSSIGRIGPLVWYLPPSANAALREFGIALFLGAVGLKAGVTFVPALTNGDGLYWMAWAALITVLPLLVVSLLGRLFLKLRFASLCGLLAGGMTDPPALAFATNMAGTDAPTLSYAAVYPMVMILRIVTAQILVLFFT